MIKIKFNRYPTMSPKPAAWLIIFFLLVMEIYGTAGLALSETDKPVTTKISTPSILAGIEDFESNDGGWIPSGPTNNWEYGAIVPGVFQNCGFTAWPFPEPATAHSGSKVWATKLNGCYENFNGTSALSKTIDVHGPSLNLELRWWQWFHVFAPYDQARVLVNDQEVWRAPDNLPTAEWVQQKVNLSAFSGQAAITVQFVMESTSEVNRMGWYLDDIEIVPYSIYLPIIFR